MAKFSIPRSHQRAFQSVADLPEDQFRALVRSLEGPGSSFSRLDLVAAMVSAAPALSSDQGNSLLTALIAAAASRFRYGYDAEEMASFVVESGDASQADQTANEERLTQLISAQSLTRLAKASDVLTEHQQILHEARILTDIRPIFEDDPSREPEAAVMLHTLRIQYHDTSGHVRSMYFGMDSDDLNTLRNVVDRALKKAASLEGLVAQLPLPLVYIEDEPKEEVP
jgi:hypothetical protein